MVFLPVSKIDILVNKLNQSHNIKIKINKLAS